MNDPEGVKIINRFYEALDKLIKTKVLRGVQTFTNEYNINRWNFITCRKKPESDMFQMSWLGYMIKDYGVSAQWLMTGSGSMFGNREFPFIINEDRLKLPLSKITAFEGRMATITYVPKKYVRDVTGKVTAIRYQYQPLLEIEIDNRLIIIPLYTITNIREPDETKI